MEPGFTSKEIYQKEFDPRAYLNMYYTAGSGLLATNTYLPFVLQNMFKTFTSGGLKGETLIDLGTGPNIHQLLSACESFEEIIASDYSEKSRREFEKWLRKEPGAFDWSSVVKQVCELEGNRKTWIEKEEKLRKTVKQVVRCDVTRSRPLGQSILPLADCLLSTGCLEYACKDRDTFQRVLKNISSLLKTGGYLILCSVLGGTFYMIGSRKFSSLPLEEGFVRKAVAEAGYVIEELEVLATDHEPRQNICDYKAVLFLVARKEKDN
ncbi:nicotinamide N-methyltransferase-like [Rhinatrema bivittatum]|uniref:nicotinamide N-methyltransferase-like n=1 Tax=Rhinatrema bivittatum TaxID=194408 RepID=UPI00112EB409|nr:nicotinamide N-methyltransferase-like [Rhinatrema bivittatum]